jgi:acylphosphatase
MDVQKNESLGYVPTSRSPASAQNGREAGGNAHRYNAHCLCDRRGKTMREAPAGETYRVSVTGVVQGVGYRDATVRHAHALKVTGWVRNCDDGSVEALLQGEPDCVDRMLEWMRHGPRNARVRELQVERLFEARRYARFERH